MNTFYHGDCLFVLRHDIAPESVDLIYLDPPFFTGKIQKGKWRPDAMEVSFEDSKRFWSEKADVMREKAPAWLRHIAIKRPDFASYLYYMMERLEACHKVLRKTGSIYLHCDYRASHYLKMVMDEILGERNFRNEIIWAFKGSGKPKNAYPRKHHVILYYGKTNKCKFYPDRIRIERIFPNNRIIEENGIKYVVFKKFNREYKYEYSKGAMIEDWWIDITNLGPHNKTERTGYPTQKPEDLLRRIIDASSDEGDLILDPFCGCGTTVIVASKLNRRFIGIDIDTSERKTSELPTAFSVIKNRGHELFAQAQYISRDLSEVLEMNPNDFEKWANEYYQATKPHPDKGVDGITPEGIPIQVKSFVIKYDVLSKFITDVKYHPNVPKPVKRVIVVSQTGFDDGARKRKFEIETQEGIEISLATPEEMLKVELLDSKG